MNVIAVYSGGLDSTVLLYHLLDRGNDVAALSVDYGQRHRRELDHARAVACQLGIEHETADLRGITHLLGGSSQTDSAIDVPHGHYAAESMKVTVVPNRNLILLAVASAWAISRRATCVAYAAHGGDHAIYPDCRPEFAEAVNACLGVADWHSIKLACPFLRLTKADIVARGAELGVPFGQTWSCYEGGQVHCGRCGTCVERREAFALAGVDDPTEYAS